MKYLILAAAAVAGAASAQGVSISAGDPDFFGPIEIGGAPPPELIDSRPVVIQPAPEFVGTSPIYLRVRPGYEAEWASHCFEYQACGRPVYFVSNYWYNVVYAPHHAHPERGWPAYQAGQEQEGRHIEETRYTAQLRHAIAFYDATEMVVPQVRVITH
jgi:hypothetical protein